MITFNLQNGFKIIAPREPDVEVNLNVRCIGKPRPRFARGRIVYSDPKYTAFYNRLTLLLLENNPMIRTPLDGQWMFYADCFYHNATISDQDNVAKALMDVIWKQDKQVSGWVERHVRRNQPDALCLKLWRIK